MAGTQQAILKCFPESDPALALDRLSADAVPRISSLGRYLGGSQATRTSVGPVGPEDMTRMLQTLFPDAREGNVRLAPFSSSAFMPAVGCGFKRHLLSGRPSVPCVCSKFLR